jgi:hypothetical protein
VEYFHGYAHHSCTVDRTATNSRTDSVGRIATNSRAARFSIGPSKCYIWEATESTSQSTSVGLRNQCVSESSSVSLRNQKSAVLAVNYRRRKPAFRRVSVVSGVRSLSLYLVVSCCVSQLVIVICVAAIIALVNKSGIQSGY